MNPKRLIDAVLRAAAILAAGCHSPSPPPTTTLSTQDPPQAPAYQSFNSQTARWTVPPNLPTFGTSTVASIRVVIFGMPGAVQRPGHYHLSQGTVVRDGVRAAGGLGPMTWWRHYSGIQRQQQDGSWQVIRFTRNRTAEEQIPLRNGDQI